MSFSWATFARRYPLSGRRSAPTTDSATWCPTPAAFSAARRLPVEVRKKSSTASSSQTGALETSTTTSASARASARPSPVMVLTPVRRSAATASWPWESRFATTLERIRPWPPMTTIFMTCLSVGSRTRHKGALFARPSPPGAPWARDPGFGDLAVTRSGRRVLGCGVRERVVELAPRPDAELREDVAQVPLDRARADEQLRADLGVRAPVTRQTGDLRLLGGQVVAGLHGALAHRLAGGQQLAAGALGEALGPHRREHLVRRAQLLARVHPPLLAAQPLAVEQPGAGEVDPAATAREPLDRLAVELLGGVAFAEQRARAGLDAERPVGAARPRAFAQALERRGRRVRRAAAHARLDQLDERP